MDLDFTRGYPIDLRPQERRKRAAGGAVGDFEGMAARVVARLTGERVIIQDDAAGQQCPISASSTRRSQSPTSKSL